MPSGDQTALAAVPPSPRGDNRLVLAVAGAVAAVVLVVAAVLVLGRGGRGGGGAGGGGPMTTVAGYTNQLEAAFVARCDSNGASKSVCQCAYDKFEATVPFKRFVEIDAEVTRNPDARPRELVDILDACVASSS